LAVPFYPFSDGHPDVDCYRSCQRGGLVAQAVLGGGVAQSFVGLFDASLFRVDPQHAHCFGSFGLLWFGTAQSPDFLARGWVETSPAFWGWTLVQAVGSIVAVGLLTRAYQTTETTYLVVFEYSLLIFASFWAYILFGQQVSVTAALGMGLIVVSGVVIALRSEDT